MPVNELPPSQPVKYDKPKYDVNDPDRLSKIVAGVYDDPTTEAPMRAAAARNDAAIKAAVLRGENPRISGDRVAHIIPPPPNYDPFNGRKCLGPGLEKAGFGNPKICGRQAVLVLKRFTHQAPKPVAPDIDALLARDAYGGPGGIVATSPRMGQIVPDPNQPPGDGDNFRCYYHGINGHKDDLHPDDNGGIIPDNTPKPEAPVIGLGNLDLTRQLRVRSSDPNFCDVTDGKTSALVPTADYLNYLREYGTLPQSGHAL